MHSPAIICCVARLVLHAAVERQRRLGVSVVQVVFVTMIVIIRLVASIAANAVSWFGCLLTFTLRSQVVNDR